MASVFGHALTAYTLGKTFTGKINFWKLSFFGMLCSILPDADVIGFKFGITYESFWGHRGFSHSLVFALIIGIVITLVFYNKSLFNKTGPGLILYFSLCTASHGILDAMTTGGLGVAFLSPFNDARYFFPWRPIQVSPIGIKNFFSPWGVKVLLSEVLWIGIPSSIYILTATYVKKYKIQSQNK